MRFRHRTASSFLRELDPIPQGDAERLQMLVRQHGVGKDDPRGRAAGERFHDSRQLFREPEIVLVGEDHDFPRAQRYRLLEIPVGTDVRRVRMNSNREGALPGEDLERAERSVRGSVVADDQLVGQARLGGDARELLLDVSLAVAGAHGDRQSRLSHGCLPDASNRLIWFTRIRYRVMAMARDSTNSTENDTPGASYPWVR